MNNNKIQQNTVAKYPQQKQWFQKLYSGDMFKNGDKSQSTIISCLDQNVTKQLSLSNQI